jgi:hypothetical protein
LGKALYRNDRLPCSTVHKGSLWWKDALKLLDKFQGIASVSVFNGQSCLLWDDLWNDQVRKLSLPELHSFAKNKSISLQKALSSATLVDLFNLPLSVQAHLQFQNLQEELTSLTNLDLNDRWTYI